MNKNSLQVGGVYKLNEITVGSIAEIIDVTSDNGFVKRRLLELGVIKGSVVQLKKTSPLGGLKSIKVKDYELALRDCDLKGIIVRLVK